MDAIERALPKDFRLKIVFADLEGPGEMIWRICPPNYYLIQRAKRKGFLGLFRGWKTVGEIDGEESAIFLNDQYYEELVGLFRTALAVYGLMVPVLSGIPPTTVRYWDRLERESSPLAGFRLARDQLRAAEPSRDSD